MARQARWCFNIVFSISWRWSTGLEIGTNIKNKCLNIVWTLIKFPKFLIATRLIMEYADNHIPIDVFSTTCPILQNLFCFCQIHQAFSRFFIKNSYFGLVIQLSDSSDEFFYIMSFIQWLWTRSLISTLLRATDSRRS